MLNYRRQEFARVLFDRFGDFDFPRTGQKLMRPDAAQVCAQRILRKPGAFFGREHGGGIFFTDVVIIPHGLIHDDVFFARCGFKDLNAQAAQLIREFGERFFGADRIIGELIVDFSDRHPTALTPHAYQGTIAIAAPGSLFIVAFHGHRHAGTFRLFHGIRELIKVFQVRQFFVGVSIVISVRNRIFIKRRVFIVVQFVVGLLFSFATRSFLHGLYSFRHLFRFRLRLFRGFLFFRRFNHGFCHLGCSLFDGLYRLFHRFFHGSGFSLFNISRRFNLSSRGLCFRFRRLRLCDLRGFVRLRFHRLLTGFFRYHNVVFHVQARILLEPLHDGIARRFLHRLFRVFFCRCHGINIACLNLARSCQRKKQ